MTSDEQEGWWANMLKVQGESLEAAVREVNRLRAEVRRIKAGIAAAPAVAYELQERVTLLEVELAKARGSAIGGVSPSRYPTLPRDTPAKDG
jgi:hypothetical protein